MARRSATGALPPMPSLPGGLVDRERLVCDVARVQDLRDAVSTGLAHGSFVPLQIFAPDQNLNRPWNGTTFSATNAVPMGTVVGAGAACGATFSSCTSVGILDAYGFGVQRVLLDAAPATLGQECVLGSTKTCQWQTVFTDWGAGNLGAQIYVLGQTVSPYQATGPWEPGLTTKSRSTLD